MGKTRLLIVGAGGNGQSVAEVAELSGLFNVVGFLDDSLSVGQKVLGAPVLGPVSSIASHRAVCGQAIVAIGNNAVREVLMQQLTDAGFEIATVIHPRAFASSSALVNIGSAVMAGALVGTEARLGVGTIVNCGAVVDHHARVEDFGHLGVNACMAGRTLLGRCAWMQAGSALGYGVSVPAGTILQTGVALKNRYLDRGNFEFNSCDRRRRLYRRQLRAGLALS
jgi:sugar O-acyltransferase (sialic acid O-acetyltransferase NeuD family)